MKTGTRFLTGRFPKEWNIRDAYIKDASGRRVVDFQQHNLHVLNYSLPVHASLPLSELRTHLHTAPRTPRLDSLSGPPITRQTWGFCLTHNRLLALDEGEYEVCIDATLEDGCLTYGECYLPGQSTTKS